MAITTTAAQVAAAVNAKAADLVVVTNFSGNDGTGLVTAMPVASLSGGDANTAATLNVDPTGANNKLTFTAVTKGADGNKIRVLYVDPGVDAPLEVLRLDGPVLYIILGTPVEPIGLAYATADLAADTGYFVNEQDLVTVTLTLGSGTRGKVLLMFDGTLGLANGNDWADVRFKVDGTLGDKVASAVSWSNGIMFRHSMHEVVIGLAPGDHTFKVRLLAVGSQVRAFAKGGGFLTAQTRLTAIEL